MFYAFEVWQTLDQPKRLTKYYIVSGYPSSEAIVEMMMEANIAQQFTLSDLQRFFKSNKMTTNDGAVEVTITPVSLREPGNGKPKTTLSQYRGFDNKEVGVYNG